MIRMHFALNALNTRNCTHLFIHYFSGLISLSFAKSFALFAPLHQRVVEERLKHTSKGKKDGNDESEYSISNNN